MAVVNSFARFYEANYPDPSHVLNTAPTYGDSINMLNGTYDPGGGGTIPAPSDVRLGVEVGQGGSGTLRVPGVADVRESVAFDAGDILVGTLDLPSIADVRAAVEFDQGSKIGNVTIPEAKDVRDTIPFDSLGSVSGTLDLPDISDVRLAVSFDNSSQIGNVRLPNEADVRAGTQYDTLDSKTGLLDVTGDVPVFPAESDVRLGTNYGTETNPTQFTGNVRAAPPEKVEAGYAYDTLDSVIGTLTVGSGAGCVVSDVLHKITRGDHAELVWEAQSGWPDLAGASVKYGHGDGVFEKAMTVEPNGDVKLTLTSEETGAMRGVYAYDVQATVGGAVSTLARGFLHAVRTHTDVPTNTPIPGGWA